MKKYTLFIVISVAAIMAIATMTWLRNSTQASAPPIADRDQALSVMASISDSGKLTQADFEQLKKWYSSTDEIVLEYTLGIGMEIRNDPDQKAYVVSKAEQFLTHSSGRLRSQALHTLHELARDKYDAVVPKFRADKDDFVVTILEHLDSIDKSKTQS